MVEDTVRSLAISIGSVFVVTLVLGGFDFKTAIITIFIIILIVLNLLGLVSKGPVINRQSLVKTYGIQICRHHISPNLRRCVDVLDLRIV